MIYFLTSSHCVVGAPELNPVNGFLDRLKEVLDEPCDALYICSDPDTFETNDRYSAETLEIFEKAGLSFTDYQLLDRRNQEDAGELVRQAGFIFLAGGHVPTQNAFLAEIGLRELLEGFDGVVMGVSAGSMNCADVVYVQPELEGEASDPDFQRFLPGLGLTQTMILPHYQQVKDDFIDGQHLFWDIACPDSVGNRFFALVDGSYVFGYDGHEELYGEAYLLEDGAMRKISREGDVIDLSESED